MVHKRDPEATRHALLEAAEAVFLEKGFGNTALSEIARRAGITKSLIHHHFGSKELLWKAVKERRIDAYAEDQMAMLETTEPTDDLLKSSIKLYFRFLKSNPEIVRILAWMFIERDTESCPLKHDALITAGVQQIRAGQEAGILRSDIDPRFMLFTFLGLAQHWFQDREHFISDFGIDGLSDDIDEAYLADMLKIFLGGVLAAG
ncbi:MAG: TetR/AcrR family transcriptional regulator [Pseudomonadota bacterium]